MANQIEIGLVIYPNSMISAIYGLTDLFRIANAIASQHEGLKRPLIRVSHWQHDPAASDTMQCIHDTHPDTPNNPTTLILPGSMIDPTPAQATTTISSWLGQKHRNGTIICSVCAGAFLLAHAGILDNRRVTTHWFFADQLAENFPKIIVEADKMIIDDGDVITAGGIMAWTDLGLRLVQRIMGPTIMLETARFLLIDPPGREQSFYNVFSPKLNHGDEQILKVQHWLQVNGARDVSVPLMANQAGMEERTFIRRFQKATGFKPTEYCQHVRINKAREMLEFTKQNVSQIAWSTGYEDPGAFRKIFQKIVGLTPGDYRLRFSMAA